MIGMGAGTRYSICKSQGDHKKANQIFTNAVFLAVLSAVVFVLIGVLFSGKIVTILGADQNVYKMTETYLRVVLLFSPAFLMNNVLLCFVRNDGAPHLSMAAMISGSLSNIVLDYFFIFPCGLGIFGAVLATGLAPIISMAILLQRFLRKQNQFHLTKCRLERKKVSDILAGGFPSLITEVSSGVVIIVFNFIILKLQGNVGVAAYGIIANLSLVVISIYTGIAQGIQPILSRNYGAGSRRNVKLILRYALAVMLIFSVLIYAGIFFGSERITDIFNSGQNEVLERIAKEGLKLYFTACPFAGFNIIISIYFTSTERPMPAHMISVLRGFFVIIPLAFLLAALQNMRGVWCTFPCTELIVSVISMLFLMKHRFREGKKCF